MATEIKKGEALTANLVKSGTNADGDAWELIIVKDTGKGKRDISVFADNAPTGVQTGDTFSVDDIRLVKWGARKDRNGYWHDFVSVNGVVKQISAAPPMPDDEPPFYPAAAPVDIYADIKEGMMDGDDDLPW